LEPGLTVFFMFTGSVSILAYQMRIFELPYMHIGVEQDTNFSLDQFFNSVWLIVITITTVGYGDISPNTEPGKIVAMVAALWGALLTSLIVVTVQSIFDLPLNQLKALKHIECT
jgi:hypothetical protein